MKLSSFLLFFLLVNASFGQRFQQFLPTQISLNSKAGFLIAHRSNMSHLPQKNVLGLELEFSRQDLGNNGWADVYKNPLAGVSLQMQDFGNPNVLGQGYAIYAHTTFPIFQGPKFGFLDFRGGTGLAFVTKKYDEVTNKKNIAIGSHLNGYVNLKLQWGKYFEHWHIGAAIEFNHYSNAATKVPNLGLNVPSLVMNLGYDIQQRQLYAPNKRKIDSELYDRRMADHLRIFIMGSAKQNPPRFSPIKSRPVIGISGLYSMNVGRRWKVDFGLDAFYNDGNRHYLDSSVYTIGETLQFGAFVGSSIHFYNAEFIVGLGAYFYSPVHPYGWFYNRLGFRYHFSDKISGTVAIKAHWGIADYLEFGIGYKLWSN